MNIKCPSCESMYVLGKTGTVDGCYECQGIIRNPRDGSIVEPHYLSALFAEDDDDTMTDMEKA